MASKEHQVYDALRAILAVSGGTYDLSATGVVTYGAGVTTRLNVALGIPVLSRSTDAPSGSAATVMEVPFRAFPGATTTASPPSHEERVGAALDLQHDIWRALWLTVTTRSLGGLVADSRIESVLMDDAQGVEGVIRLEWSSTP